jgi:hypothetical protein
MSSSASAHPHQLAAATILKECLQREKRLAVARENPKDHGQEIAHLVGDQRAAYKRLLIEFTEYTSTCPKDVDGGLWRQCFYQQIVEYRKSIRKTVQVIEKIGRQSQSSYEKANAHLAQLNSAFRKFLIDSTDFYQQFLLQVRNLDQVAPFQREICYLCVCL